MPSSYFQPKSQVQDGIYVLVIEDEVLVRLSIAAHLRLAGFRVAEAGNADDALRLLGQEIPFAAVITDLKMPGSLDGLQLCAWLNRARPDVKIIITTAYPDLGAAVPDICRYQAMMQKPYDLDAILHKLQDILQTGDGA